MAADAIRLDKALAKLKLHKKKAKMYDKIVSSRRKQTKKTRRKRRAAKK
jgi:hypothetical protein